MKKLSIAALVAIAITAHAKMLTYKKAVNPKQLAAEIKAATGYAIVRRCKTCVTQGFLISDGTSVSLTFYDKRDVGLYQSSVTANAAFISKMNEVVAHHVPTPKVAP